MNDEQIIAAAKSIDTPHGKISLIHTREDGSEVPTFVAQQFVRSILAAQSGWWNIFRKPTVDKDGQWSIDEECTKTGKVTVHLYDDEAAANAAYQDMFDAMINGKTRQ